jgi:hypothetical protein
VETLKNDGLRWTPVATVEKFTQEQTAWLKSKTGLSYPERAAFSAFDLQPYEVRVVEGNLLTTSGLNRLTSLLIGAGGQALTATAIRIGVGDDSTAAAVGDTDLSTGSNQYYRVMDSTYPQQSNGVVTAKGTFGDADGNFAWNCWGIDVGTPTVSSSGTVAALLFNRKVSSLGTKSTGTWALTITITFS